jgi:hypothetical protein
LKLIITVKEKLGKIKEKFEVIKQNNSCCFSLCELVQ